MHQNKSSELIYIADPMCSWCYGFGPHLDAVLEAVDLPVRLIMGGLYVGDAAPPGSDTLRLYLNTTWRRVEQMSGQQFRTDLIAELVSDAWIYDTGPSCQAVIDVRNRDTQQAFTLFRAIQQAFYQRGEDVTQPSVLQSVAANAGIHAIQRGESSLAPSLVNDIADATALGATGFPVLILATERANGTAENIPVATGFTRASQMLRKLAVLL